MLVCREPEIDAVARLYELWAGGKGKPKQGLWDRAGEAASEKCQQQRDASPTKQAALLAASNAASSAYKWGNVADFIAWAADAGGDSMETGRKARLARFHQHFQSLANPVAPPLPAMDF